MEAMMGFSGFGKYMYMVIMQEIHVQISQQWSQQTPEHLQNMRSSLDTPGLSTIPQNSFGQILFKWKNLFGIQIISNFIFILFYVGRGGVRFDKVDKSIQGEYTVNVCM